MIRNRTVWRKVLVYAAYVSSVGLLQAVWPDQLALWGQKPDLTLVLAVLTGYLFGAADGFAVGLAAGLLRDMLFGRTLGLGMLLLMYAGIAASTLLGRFFRRHVLFGLVQVAVLTLLYEGMIVLLTFLVPLLPDGPHSLPALVRLALPRLPGQLLANLAAGLPLALLLAWMGPYRRGSSHDEQDSALSGDSLWQIEKT